MIIGYLDDWKTYEKNIPQIEEIVKLAKESREKPCGRYETEWGFYMIQEGKTLPLREGSFESHQRYADIQCVLEGCEYMEWQDTKKLEPDVPYSEEKDIQFWKGEGSLMEISSGMFYMVYPRDGHKPGRHVDEEKEYRKMVVKIRL